MKSTLNLFLFWLLACSPTLESKENKLENEELAVIQQNDTYDSPFIINGERYEYFTKDGGFYMLAQFHDQYEDTIIKPADHYFALEILDVNRDDFQDLRVHIFANMPNVCDTYIYRRNTTSFQHIDNVFLDFKQVDNSELYYTYLRSGCADSNWTSSLGYIQNNSFEIIGKIYGIGCEAENTKQYIKIVKLSDAEEELLETLPYNQHVNEGNDKWSFIKEYWAENMAKFRK